MSALSFCTQLANLREEVDSLSGGDVSLRRGGVDTIYYRAEDDTNEARFAALQAAMAEAATDLTVDAVVTLESGQFGIPAGISLVDFSPVNAVIVFGPGTSVLYADENDAAGDARVYMGDVRYASNFGAGADVPDSQPRLQAALFSLPATGDGVYRPQKYPLLETRRGTLFLDDLRYTLQDTLWITGFNTIEGIMGRESILFAGEGFAPESGDEKFVVETACWMPVSTVDTDDNPGAQIGANFTFGIRLWHFVVANLGLTGASPNTKVSGIRYGCAQHGAIKVTTVGMGIRGLYLLPNTSHIDVYHWGQGAYGTGPGGTGSLVQRGPTLSGDSVFSCTFFISEEQINNLPVDDHLEYSLGGVLVPLAAVMFSDSYSLRFPNAAGEQCGNYMHFKNCHSLRIGQISVFASNTPSNCDTVLRLDNCINSGFESMQAAYYQYAYKVTAVGTSEMAAGGAGFIIAGPFNTLGDPYMLVTGTPIVNNLPANHARDIRDPVSGVMKRWINHNNTDMKSVTYGYEEIKQLTTDPLLADIPLNHGFWAKVSGTGELRFWSNDNGTLKKSAALTV